MFRPNTKEYLHQYGLPLMNTRTQYYLFLTYFQITSDYNSSSLTVEANNTNSTTDNGMYNCQIVLFIAEIDAFSSTSNYSMVSFKGIHLKN